MKGFRWAPYVAAVLALAGCAQPPPPAAPDSASSPPAVASRTASPAYSPPPEALARAQAIASAMTPEQKAGQLILVEWDHDRSTLEDVAALVTSCSAGGVLYLGAGWTMDNAALASAALAGAKTVPDVRPFIAMDQEGGAVQRLKTGAATIPSALDQGAWPAEQLRQAARDWGQDLARAGVNVNLAPVADTVPTDRAPGNAPIGALNRQFGNDPLAVGQHAAAFVQGMSDAGVMSTLKHFPGLGMVSENPDFTQSPVTDTVSTTTSPEIEAFAIGLTAEPAMVMVSWAVYEQIDPGHMAAFSPAIIDGLLRDGLGWRGIVIADSMNASVVSGIPAGDRAISFINAGGDLMTLRTQTDIQAAWSTLVDQIKESPDFAARVDASVVRILLAKDRAGLVDP